MACGGPHGATVGTLGVCSHRFMSVDLYSGADIEVQDGVFFSFPFGRSCVLANHIRSFTTQGEGRWCGVGAVCFCLLQAAIFSLLKVMEAAKMRTIYGTMAPVKVSCPLLRSHHCPFVL